MTLGVDAYNLAGDRRGMGRVVRYMLERLQALGVKIVLVVRDDRDTAALAEEFPFETARAHELRTRRLDAVWYPWNGMRFAPHARAVVTLHDPFAFVYPHRNPVARLREQAPIRRAIARADAIVAVSQWTAGEIARLFPRSTPRLTVVPNAITPFWQPVSVPQNVPHFLFVGATDERKNAALLFDAYDRAFAAGGPELVIAGSLNAAAESRLEAMRAPYRRVHPGDAELRERYAGALAVLVPSIAEGFGLIAAEAMACGAPVIAADAAALPETCGGAAMLLPPGDANAWAQGMQRLAQDAGLRAQMRAAGRERAAAIGAQRPAERLLALLQPLRR